MPKVDMDYSNTIIYKIVCKDITINECYVGQTTNFTKRKYNHKSRCNNINDKIYNNYIYQFIRENGNWDNWDMIEIEKYNAVDKNDACKRERYWIENLQAKLNKVIPTRTDEEYREQTKEQRQIYDKNYHQQNRENKAEYKKKYYEKNKEKIKIKSSENGKLYYEKNKQLYQQKYNCICGGKYTKKSKSTHEKTLLHINYCLSLNSVNTPSEPLENAPFDEPI
jgi:hypothetical protein